MTPNIEIVQIVFKFAQFIRKRKNCNMDTHQYAIEQFALMQSLLHLTVVSISLIMHGEKAIVISLPYNKL